MPDILGKNPSQLQGEALRDLMSVLEDGYELGDFHNATSFVLGGSAKMVHNLATDIENHIHRAMFPQNATKMSELYYSMSDYDYTNLTSTPATTTYNVILEQSELYERMVDDETGTYKEAIIPETTIVQLGGVKWTLPYPVRIRIHKATKSKLIEFLTDYPSPFAVSASTDNLLFNVYEVSGQKLIRISIPVYQVARSYTVTPVSAGVGFKLVVPYTDRFLGLQAFHDGVALKQTLTDDVYDISTPTVKVSFDESSKQVTAEIPYIYIDKGLISKPITIQVMTTLGEVDIPLSGDSIPRVDYQTNLQYSVMSNSLVEPMIGLSYQSFAIDGDTVIQGGTNGLTFAQLKERILSRGFLQNQTPIGPNQVKSLFTDYGFGLLRLQDDLTKRIYLATRVFTDTNNRAVHVLPGKVKIDPLEIDNISSIVKVGTSILMKPSCIYKEIGTKTYQPLTDTELATLNANSSLDLIDALNNDRYVRLPFFTVLDTYGQYPTVNTFDFKTPKVDTIQFTEQNDKIVEQATLTQMEIEHDEAHELFTFRAGVTVANYDASSIPVGAAFGVYLKIKTGETSDPVYLPMDYQGMVSDAVHVWSADLTTTYVIDERQHILVNGYDALNRAITSYIPIEDASTEIIVVGRKDQLSPTLVRDPHPYELIGLYTDLYEMVTRQNAIFNFGTDLTGINFTSVDVSLTPEVYATWPTDIYHTYARDVYQTDVNGVPVLDVDGISLILEHSAGDQVLDGEGQPIIKYEAGSVRYENDLPVVQQEARQLFYIGTPLFDGRLFRSTDTTDVEFVKQIPAYLNGLKDTLGSLQNALAEETEVYFQPIRTMGDTEFGLGNGATLIAPLDLSFTVQIHVGESTYTDAEAKALIEEIVDRTIIQTITSATTTISVKNILKTLDESLGDLVESIDTFGINGQYNLQTIFITETGVQPTIGRSLYLKADGRFGMKHDIDITFVKASV